LCLCFIFKYARTPAPPRQIEACKQAGLQEVHLITEPEAAALAFGLGRRESGKSKEAMEAARGDRQKVERTLVVDLGGGTFDVSVRLRVGAVRGFRLFWFQKSIDIFFLNL
jgi:molecular chaperone DnaK (HSP70)